MDRRSTKYKMIGALLKEWNGFVPRLMDDEERGDSNQSLARCIFLLRDPYSSVSDPLELRKKVNERCLFSLPLFLLLTLFGLLFGSLINRTVQWKRRCCIDVYSKELLITRPSQFI